MTLVLVSKLFTAKFANDRFVFSFCYMYSWQCQTNGLFSYHSDSVVCIFALLKSLISFDIIECIEIEKDACGDPWLLTSFDLIEYVFADIGALH